MLSTGHHTQRRSLIRDLRIAANMPRRIDLALKAGVSTTYVQELENGLYPKRHGTPAFTAVCEALGVSEDQIRGDA